MSLFSLHPSGLSPREIGRKLNRSHASISRELKRNKRIIGCIVIVQLRTLDARKVVPRHRRCYSNVKLKAYVKSKLKLGWSPEMISNRMIRDYPHSLKNLRISPETTYQWIFQDAEQGGTLYTHLVLTHKKRRK